MKAQTKTQGKMIEKMKWTFDRFKASEDIVDRTACFIATLSSHNLWKGSEAIDQIIQSQQNDLLDRVDYEIEELRLGGRDMEKVQYNQALDDLKAQIDELRKSL